MKISYYCKKIICYFIGHTWQYQGKRSCPYGDKNCFIPVHFCLNCGEYDLSDGMGFSKYNHCKELVNINQCNMINLIITHSKE